MLKPKISIAMSVYRYNRMPIRGIQTILSQSMEDFEFILVDDGNNDGTEKILAEYARNDSRIKLIVNEERLRLASARNKAITKASAEYIAIADADIAYHPDRLKIQLEFIKMHPDIDVLGSNFYWILYGDEQSREVILPQFHNEIIHRLSITDPICNPSLIFKRDKLLPYGPYQEDFGRAEDYHLWMRIRNKVIFHNLQQFLLTKWNHPYRWNEISKIDCFKGELKSRLAGFSTSPCVFTDIICFPLVFKIFLSGTWIHKSFKSLKENICSISNSFTL